MAAWPLGKLNYGVRLQMYELQTLGVGVVLGSVGVNLSLQQDAAVLHAAALFFQVPWLRSATSK